MEKGKKILMIIDPQNDFIDGTLVVPGAVTAMDGLSSYIREHSKEYKSIIITVDWHPFTHCSFEENGGQWPLHCVQFTVGAAIHKGIMSAIKDTNADCFILTKGTNEDREEYSVFNNIVSSDFLKTIKKFEDINEIDICGLAGDVCVLNTLKDALKMFDEANINVIEKFSPSIDGGKALSEFVNSTERVKFI